MNDTNGSGTLFGAGVAGVRGSRATIELITGGLPRVKPDPVMGAVGAFGVSVHVDSAMPENVIQKLDAKGRVISMLVRLGDEWFEINPNFGPFGSQESR